MAVSDLLNEKQLEAVKHVDGPLLILAGAGSGKTRVITFRIAYLISKVGVSPLNILAVTFTNKASQEMRERIKKTAGKAASNIWMSTFHAMGVRILRRHADKIGYTNNFSIFDQDDRERLVKECMHDCHISDREMKSYEMMKRIQDAKNNLIEPPEYAEKYAGNYEGALTAKVFEVYERRIKANNAMDFDDLISKPIELFSKRTDVLDEYREKFRYILIDEYQDINNSQYTLISMIAEKYKNICVVGDDDQSIYRFRGADITNILDFEEDYPQAKVIRLEQNYRSTKMVLKAAHSVIKNNAGRKDKQLWTENDEGEKLTLYYTNDEIHESECVLDEIGRIMRETGGMLKDIAVFYRTNAQSRVIEDRLRRAGIPYKLIGGLQFYGRMEIKDVLAYLRIISNPKDVISLKRIINVPSRGIGDVSMQKIEKFSFEGDISFLEGMGRADEVPGLKPLVAVSAKKFYGIIQKLTKNKEVMSMEEILKDLLSETGYIDFWRNEATMKSKERVENLKELVSAVAEYEESKEDPTLEDFLNQVALVSDVDKLDADANAVTLMTVHSAKGLEFDNVFIAGMDEGLFPHKNCVEEEDGIEEERRLAYVAITRARKKLWLLSALSRRQYGARTAGTISRFINEIPEEFVVRKGRPPVNTIKEKYEGKINEEEQYALDDTPSYDGIDEETAAPNKPGDRVKHKKMGEGIIVGIEPYGEDFKVTVAFKRYGKRILSAKMAGLQRV